MDPRTRYISLFSGVGGLDLAVRIALPESRCVCFVEGEVPATEVLAARMEEGSVEDAPIWSDVRSFDGKPWHGLVDGIVGGFPCQDLSVAGKGEGIKRGNRSGLWFQFARIIREVQPQWVFIENVSPVLHFPAGRTVLGELAEMGFDAEWLTLAADAVGAPHKRERVFILAYPASARGAAGLSGPDAGDEGQPKVPIDGGCGLFPPGPNDHEAWRELLVREPWLRPAWSQEEAERLLRGEFTGPAPELDIEDRTDRLRSLGNLVCPLQGAVALAVSRGMMRNAKSQ